MPFGGLGMGLLVESHMGRPTKVEGNPAHPASLGAADIFAQASVLGLYDPDRSQVAVRNGRIGSWSAFLTAMDGLRLQLATNKGAGFRLLTETITSPALSFSADSIPIRKMASIRALRLRCCPGGLAPGFRRVRKHGISI
jgi:molybdopterin-containing oxidoreductase family iron-sulfur binding subunit